MSRAVCLYLLGAAVVALGTFTASVAHGNNAAASQLSQEVHAQSETRARIESTRARVEAQLAQLRADHARKLTEDGAQGDPRHGDGAPVEVQQ